MYTKSEKPVMVLWKLEKIVKLQVRHFELGFGELGLVQLC